jgi:hypothetical protein
MRRKRGGEGGRTEKEEGRRIKTRGGVRGEEKEEVMGGRGEEKEKGLRRKRE